MAFISLSLLYVIFAGLITVFSQIITYPFAWIINAIILHGTIRVLAMYLVLIISLFAFIILIDHKLRNYKKNSSNKK